MDLNQLNQKYRSLTPEERIREIYSDFNPEKILLTSSFGTTSVYLLEKFYAIHQGHPVHFINTRFLFKETLSYKNRLKELLNLKVVDLEPESWDHSYTREHKTWEYSPDACCTLNKVKPIDLIKANFEVWVSGLSGSQNEIRDELEIFEIKNGILRFYPLVDVRQQEMESYIIRQNLPVHPLKFQGYGSVGCTHCTVKGKGRSGRWIGLEKTECGLHAG